MGNKAFRLLVKATKHFFSNQWIIIGKTKQNRTKVSFAWENKDGYVFVCRNKVKVLIIDFYLLGKTMS